MSEIAGRLYRRSPRLFNKNKPGEWTLVWCELVLASGELQVLQGHERGRRLTAISVRECDIAHVRVDGRECIEISIRKGAKKEIFASHESSHDLDWWMNTLLSVKKDLACGITPRVSIVCPPSQEVPARQKNTRKSSAAVGSSIRATIRRQPELQTRMTLCERFTIYETAQSFYIVCSDRHYSRLRLIKLDRTIERPLSLSQIFEEDPQIYTWDEMEAKLQKARAAVNGKLTRSFTAVAIVGCIRFLRGYYFIFVTQRRKIGCIGGNFIYGIQATQQLSTTRTTQDTSAWNWLNRWFNPSPEEEAEARYLGLFHFIDLTKDFFFSYSYDVTHTLQHNMTVERSEPSEMFTWNHYLTQELKACLSAEAGKELVIPLVLGCYEQRKCSVFGRLISIILLARRSRHYAGTRYLKRGVADTGKAANDVETEQIIEDENMGAGRFSSFVQYRGSIPVYWSQETSATLPKPPIVLNRVDPTYTSTRKHFADLFARYGSPVVALNLVKQSEKKEREVIVGGEFMNAVEYLNGFIPPEHRIRYIALDYSRLSKQKGLNVLHSLDKVAAWALTQSGFFCSAPKRQVGHIGNKQKTKLCLTHLARNTQQTSLSLPEAEEGKGRPSSPTIPRNSGEWLEQRGVLRTNCIDCLDRTNVCQFSVGMRALGQQLYAMGIRNTPFLESRSQLVRVLMLLYSLVGDAISMQYGGSEAHKNVKNSAGRENVKHRELLTSIRRYYSNSFTDMAKQDAINIFLGHFVPKENEPPLWELESDYYLHNFEVRKATSSCDPCHEIFARALLFDKTPMINPEDSNRQLQEGCRYYRLNDRNLRDEYVRQCKRILEEWWKQPLELFESSKYHVIRKPIAIDQVHQDVVVCEQDQPKDGAKVNEVAERQCSDRFTQMYHPDELTYFDKALGYKFMNPMDLSNDVNEDNDQSGSTSKHISADSASNSAIHSTTGRSASTDESMNTFIHSTRRTTASHGVVNRAARSMSAPDIGEDSERIESSKRCRENTSRIFRLDEEGEIYHSSSNINSSEANQSENKLSSLGRLSGGNRLSGNVNTSSASGRQVEMNPHLKSALKKKDEQLSIEDYVQSRGHRKFIGSSSNNRPDSVYERYVHWNRSPTLWETDNESVKMYFEAYLSDHAIDVDDARKVRDAQVRGGATFKIQAGQYGGLDQNVKARVLVAKKLKTDPEDRKIFEDSLDMKKLVSTGESSVPSESLDLYKSFFDDDLPDVSHMTSRSLDGTVLPKSSVSLASAQLAEDFKKMSLFKHKANGRQRGPPGLISVGPLLKLDGGKDKDFILFNETAAENDFCEVFRSETELSFYMK